MTNIVINNEIKNISLMGQVIDGLFCLIRGDRGDMPEKVKRIVNILIDPVEDHDYKVHLTINDVEGNSYQYIYNLDSGMASMQCAMLYKASDNNFYSIRQLANMPKLVKTVKQRKDIYKQFQHSILALHSDETYHMNNLILDAWRKEL